MGCQPPTATATMFWTHEDIHDREEQAEELEPASSTLMFGPAGGSWPDPLLNSGPTADQLALDLDLDLDLPFLGEPAYDSSRPTTSTTPTSPGDGPGGREESTPCTSELSSSRGTPSYGEFDFGSYDGQHRPPSLSFSCFRRRADTPSSPSRPTPRVPCI